MGGDDAYGVADHQGVCSVCGAVGVQAYELLPSKGVIAVYPAPPTPLASTVA